MELTAVQILVAVFALFAIIRVAMKAKSRSLPVLWSVLLIIVFLGVGYVAVMPGTTDVIASSIGIGRGIDLIVYLAIVALFYLVFRLVVKIETLQRDITKLVREIAIRDMEVEDEYEDPIH